MINKELKTGAANLSRLFATHRESACNWLAMGLLLAAWNAVNDSTPLAKRPQALRSYPVVSVRAVQRTGEP
jgi:hypothetical protein